jgi:hypothetical protein
MSRKNDYRYYNNCTNVVKYSFAKRVISWKQQHKMVHFIPEKLNRMTKSTGAHVFHTLWELPQNTRCHKGDIQQVPQVLDTMVQNLEP